MKLKVNLFREKNIPIGIITNGGGERELNRAAYISKVLCLDKKYSLNESEVFLCHSPMKELRDTYKDKLILVSGVGEVEKVMMHYGFKDFITTEEYCVHFPVLISQFFHEKE